MNHGFPEKYGLYDPEYEKDACGVGFVAHIKGRASHQIVKDANRILCNMDHRGARGSETNTGDGAGMLTALPLFIFLLKFLLKSSSKSTFFCCDVKIRFWSCKSLQIVESVCVVLLRFATHCLLIAVEWLRQGSSLWQLHAYYYCVLQLKVVNRIVMAA